MTITAKQYLAINRKSRGKMGNIQMYTDGGRFDSKLEAAVYSLLVLRMRAKEFVEIKRQVQVDLVCGITHKIDFQCVKKDGSHFYVEAKGFEDATWRLKRKLHLGFGDAPVEIWFGTHQRPFLKETLVPDERHR